MKCYFCHKELENKDYRGLYKTIIECECGAINYIGDIE